MAINRKLNTQELNRITIEQFKIAKKREVVVVLDNVRSGHNIGSAFRTADAFAIEAIYLCGICRVPPSAEIRKSALGAEESVTWRYFKESTQAVASLIEAGYRVVAVEQTLNSISLEHFTIEKERPYALVFGNEVKGVSQEVIDMCHSAVEIPQWGTKHSLNLSVAVGVTLWELVAKL
ncbi:MAG: RNA methyltransferase [Bacteroidales bacterium]